MIFTTKTVLKLFEAFSIQRWNDLIRPFEIVEMDKTAEKTFLAYIIGKYEEKKGKKIDTYRLDATSVRAKTVTSNGETECTLYLTRQGENETTVNCELIGIAQFEKLLSDLGIDGDPVTKLDTVTENRNK